MSCLRTSAVVLTGTLSLSAIADAQSTAAQRIRARAGDLIVVENDDRVGIIRRRDAQVRAIYDSQGRWLIVLVDYASPAGDPDGRVDAAFRYHDLMGSWPLGERWEGRAVIENYSVAGDPSPSGWGLASPAGLIQVLPPGRDQVFADQSATATIVFAGAGQGGGASSFDVAEEQQRAYLAASVRPPSTTAPVRVGGNISVPTKIHDVRPVYPEAALAARITGRVVLEAVIGTDGAVTEAKVLSSVPELDAAAINAVRQWRFTPTYLNGSAVPVIMTVTVSFNLK